MKRVFAILLALVLVLSMSVPAFAATVEGSITVSNVTPGKEYKIYKIFDATHSVVDGKTAVNYKIDPNSDLYKAIFVNSNGSDYFTYNEDTDEVKKVETATDASIVTFLTNLANTMTADETIVAPADAESVVFDKLPLGYYVVVSSLGATVTITTNAPDVVVIDKNQVPFTPEEGQFSKTVAKAFEGEYGDGVSVNIGDTMYYKVTFNATNYYEDQKIKYYQIHDEIGSAIWMDFESIQVSVGGEPLTRGYYLNGTGAPNDYGWTTLGNWGTVEHDVDNAQWYLVHLSENRFRITIPWLEGHELEPLDTYTFRLNTPLDHASLYDTGDTVLITYKGVLTSDAIIGGGDYIAMRNRAHATAICQEESYPSLTSDALTEVYGLGILKDDSATRKNLAGAKFRLWKDEACTQPVYVIPTDCDGVYMVDSLGKEGLSYDGIGNKLPRERFANVMSKEDTSKTALAVYLNGNTQDNYVVSQLNGKLVVLGLEEGNYWLQEVEAPKGYNSLTEPVPLELKTSTATAFTIFANSAGDVVDDQFGAIGYTEREFTVTNTTVHNSQGVELPSTGGEGTILLITMGTILAMAFAVLMITQKKMSIYKD